MIAGRNLHVHDQPPVERHDKAAAGSVRLETPDDSGCAALEDPKDPSLSAAVGDALDPRNDAVAVHGLIQIAAGDIDVAGDAINRAIGYDESEAARMGRDPPDDQIHPIRQAVSVSPSFDERTLADQVLQQAFEGRALVPRDFQALQELSRRRRMLDLVANQLEQLFVVQHMFNPIQQFVPGSGRES